MKEFPYDTPIEVTEWQYLYARRYFRGIVAHRLIEGKYYIKLMLSSYQETVEEHLNNKKL